MSKSADNGQPMVSSAKYIALDVESCGLDISKSLLSVYLVILDENLNPIDELDLLTKPNDGVYHLTAEALGVNGINIVEHDKVAITADYAGTKIYDFLNKNNPNGKVKLIPVGHNVTFDIEFVCAHTLAKKSWSKFCGYRCLDTGTISQFLIARGELPQMSASLGTIAAHFGIEFAAHTAKGDTLATVAVLKKMLNK